MVSVGGMRQISFAEDRSRVRDIARSMKAWLGPTCKQEGRRVVPARRNSSKRPSLFMKLYKRPECAKPSAASVLVDAAPNAADEGDDHDRHR